MFSIDYFKSILSYTIAFAIALIIPIGLGTENFGFVNLLSLLFIALLSVTIGKTISRHLQVHCLGGFSTAFEIILGFSILSFLQLIFTFLFKLNAVDAVFVSSLFVCVLLVINTKFFTDNSKRGFAFNLKLVALDTVVMLFISIMTTLWCRDIINSLAEARQTGIFHAWPDIFLHAVQIVSLQNYHDVLDASLFLSGTKQPVYHIASYALPAFYSGINNELAIVSATSFLVPCGLILSGLGVYGFGCLLANRFVGFAAVAALFMLPDASMYGLKIGFFGYQWLMQASPGSGYALAIVLSALGLYVLGIREGKFSFIIYAVILAVFSAFFRVQIAAPATIMMFILALIVWKPATNWHRYGAYIALLLLTVFMMCLSEIIDIGPHFITGEYTGSKFFQEIHDRVLLSGYASSALGKVYQFLITNLPIIVNWLIGYAVFLTTALGLIFPLLALLMPKKLLTTAEWKIDMIPAVLLLSSFLIIVSLPVPIDGDFSNFGHRQFVLIYVVCLIFLISWLTNLINRHLFRKQVNSLSISVICLPLLFVGLLTPWVYGKGIQQPNGWSQNIADTAMPSGLYKASTYIKENSHVRDIMLNSDLDRFATVVSITERQAYISRDLLYSNYKGIAGDVFRQRHEELGKLNLIETTSDLCAFAEKRNIKWLLKHPNDFIDWNSRLLNSAVYVSDGYQVYDLQRQCG